MTNLENRLGATPNRPARVRTQIATPRLRTLLREIVVEEHGLVGAYKALSDAAGELTDDIWSDRFAEGPVRELTNDLDWLSVYEMLEAYAPKPLSGLDGYDGRVNDVLARDGVAYQMVHGRFGPFDPEGEEFGLGLTNPVDGVEERFAPVRRQYQRALEALTGVSMDPLAAVRESMNALEALGRIIVDQPKASLGDVVSVLVTGSSHRKALAAALKSLYGYSSTVPGARHGEHETVDIGFPEASFVVRSAGAAIAMLIAEQRRSSS